jgi:hypothetical protein
MQQQQEQDLNDDDDRSPKRKRIVLNYAQRLEVWDKMCSGMAPKQIAEQFNVGLSTLVTLRNRITKDPDRFHAEYAKQLLGDKKIVKESMCPYVDKALKLWFYQQRAKFNFLTHGDLQEKVDIPENSFKFVIIIIKFYFIVCSFIKFL